MLKQMHLTLLTGAYWLMWSLRRLMPTRSFRRVAQFNTRRLRLPRIAVRMGE
jgi:hypothetical protein